MVRTIFIGSSDFGIPTLKTLLELDYIDLVAVITQPDRPVGRKQVLNPTQIKQFISSTYNLERKTIDIITPEKLNKVADEVLAKYKPDLIVVAAYGQIISKKILNYPKYGALNLHGSLLPKLRGAVPVQMSILHGFNETGVTLQKMVYALDAGDIISIRKIKLNMRETTEELMNKLSLLSSRIIREDLKKWIDGEIAAIPQDESEATFCDKTDLAKENAEIRFETDVVVAKRMVRAFYPWPIAWFTIPNGKYKGKKVKIFKAEVYKKKEHKSQNQKLDLTKESKKLVLQLNGGAIVLEELQLEGKRRDNSQNYLYLTT